MIRRPPRSTLFPTRRSSDLFAYDMVRLIERLPERLRDDVGEYDAMMTFYLGIVAFDHVLQRVWIIRNVYADGRGTRQAKYDAAVQEIAATRQTLEKPLDDRPRPLGKQRRAGPLRVQSNFRHHEYLAAVRKAKEYIRAGDVFQVVLSQR